MVGRDMGLGMEIGLRSEMGLGKEINLRMYRPMGWGGGMGLAMEYGECYGDEFGER